MDVRGFSWTQIKSGTTIARAVLKMLNCCKHITELYISDSHLSFRGHLKLKINIDSKDC